MKEPEDTDNAMDMQEFDNYDTENRIIEINTEALFLFKDTCEDQIKFAGEAGAKNFTIYLEPMKSNSIPKKPHALKKELEGLVENHSSIESCIHARNGNLVIKTKCVDSAIQISRITTLMGVPVMPKVHSDNLTTKFLLRNISTDCSLDIIKDEIENNFQNHSLKVQSLRRFRRKGSVELSENILVCVYGTQLPAEIKIFLTVEHPKRFIDSARQCSKCFKFSHS